MNLMQVINRDKEIQQLKKDYKEKYKKNAPPYTIGQYNGIEDYKKRIKELMG